jgi:D-sedoheptulose 7-phosphate isomerase
MKETILAEIRRHRNLLDALEAQGFDTIEATARTLIDAVRSGGHIYLCGNGGSAADAQHVAGELMGRFRSDRPALPAVSLNSDSSVLTAVGNDYAFEDVFARQVEALARENDVLWAFSTSGESPNVVKAVEAARRKGVKVITFVGRSDSRLAMCGGACVMADVCFCVDSPETSTVQEMHQLAYHIVCNLVERAMGEA